MLNEALTLSTKLGMRPLKERAAGLLDRLKELIDAPAGLPSGLTAREVEVLRLVSSGSTDREIAEESIIGVRTVSTHVANIFNKICANNRVEATKYANQHGFVTPAADEE